MFILPFSKMEYSLECHKTNLNKLCRICGKYKLSWKEEKSGRKAVMCNDYAIDILMLLGVDI